MRFLPERQKDILGDGRVGKHPRKNGGKNKCFNKSLVVTVAVGEYVEGSS